MRKKVLIVDDEEGIRSSLKLLLKKNFEVDTAESGEQALGLLAEFKPDLVLLDVMMPRLDGLETLKQLKEHNRNVAVIMLTAANTVKTAVQAIKFGAVDYLNKPFDVEELTSLIISTLEQSTTSNDIKKEHRGRRPEAPEADFGKMVGRSPAMSELFKRVQQVAVRDTTVLIMGESGTGKELIARRIHDLSSRVCAPFVAINCAAIPESLIESELFGHEKGAFTNAVDKRIGHFELADGGTLFLDEIGELSLPVQVKMLRFLQEQEFYRVGSSKAQKVNVRIIAATNKNLETLISEGKFREDLYYRINVVSVDLPALRDRFEDIPHLVNHFKQKFTSLYGGKELSFQQSALDTLIQYDWPGNVRELENVIESLMALVPGDSVSKDDLPPRLKARPAFEPFKKEIFQGQMNFEDAERVFETEMIVKALKKTGYVQTRAAELLGISRRILKYKMDKLGISDNPEAVADNQPPSAPEKRAEH